MGEYMRNNGMQLIVEQKDYPKGSFSTAWGVADEVIFDKALATYDSLAATGAPFYSTILSVSNHKPYEYPTGRIAADPSKHWRTNAVQYADYALGRFIRMAKEHPWFDNTLFVLMGDHGARVYGASEIPLPSYEVPVLFYAPGFIPAGASHRDARLVARHSADDPRATRHFVQFASGLATTSSPRRPPRGVRS